MKPHLLIVDDEPDVRDVLTRVLTTPDKESREVLYRVTAVRDGAGMRRVILQDPVDLFIVDIRLLGTDGQQLEEDGLAITKWLREHSDISILVYSAKAEEVDEIAAFDVGADDYLRKPSSAEVIRARVQALLRRREVHIGPQSQHMVARGKIVAVAGLRFEIGSREITLADGESVSLSYSEHDFLSALVRSPDGHLTREELNAFVLGRGSDARDRRLDNLVNRLRHKLKNPTLIRSVRGKGYTLTVPVQLLQTRSEITNRPHTQSVSG